MQHSITNRIFNYAESSLVLVYMIAEYISKAMFKAHYELIDDNEPFYGCIPELNGVWATGKSLEECRQTLITVLEEWILLRVKRGLVIPVIDGISIDIPQELLMNE